MAGSGDNVTNADIYEGGFDATTNVLNSVEKSGTGEDTSTPLYSLISRERSRID